MSLVLSLNISVLELQQHQLLQKGPSRRFYIACAYSTPKVITKMSVTFVKTITIKSFSMEPEDRNKRITRDTATKTLQRS